MQSYSYIDQNLAFDQPYYYWLECIELNGISKIFGYITITIEQPDVPQFPQTTLLKQAYPNPFNPTTTIAFDIKEGENGILTIYNLKGEKMLSKMFYSGYHKFEWNADKNASGVYLYRLKTNTYTKINKMLMLK